MAIFDNASGSKYRLPFPGGSIVATDFFFNEYFTDAAFAAQVDTGVLVDVAGSTYQRTRFPGDAAKSVTRRGYSYRRHSMGVGTRNAVGTECYVKDGRDRWKFAISGPIGKFVDFADAGGKMKKVFHFTTAHGSAYKVN